MRLIPNQPIFDLIVPDNCIDTKEPPFMVKFWSSDMIYIQWKLEACDAVRMSYIIRLVNEDSDIVYDLSSYSGQTLNGDWFTLKFKMADDLGVPNGCYRIQYEQCPGGQTYSTNLFMVTDKLDCTKEVTATSSCYSLGFDWSVFALHWRIPFARFNPEYDLGMEDYLNSEQRNFKQYAERGKFWTIRTADMDEGAHDCLTVMLLCNQLLIDGIEFYFSKKDYSLEWDKEGKTLLASAQFQLRKQENTPTNTNCQDCEDEFYYYYAY